MDVSAFLVGHTDHGRISGLSNFANDYGDGVRGTDQQRVEARMVASGLISAKQMKRAVWITAVLSFSQPVSCISGLVRIIFNIFQSELLASGPQYTQSEAGPMVTRAGVMCLCFYFGLLAVLGSATLFLKSLNFVCSSCYDHRGIQCRRIES